MMKAKRMFAALLAVMMILALAACSGSSTSETTAAATEATTEAEETTEEEAEPEAEGYKAGTYTASAQGMESQVTVTITIDENGVITDCEVDSSNETAQYGALVSDPTSSYYIIDQILEAQSADIDGVSGVTMTSKAVKTALADCLEQAMERG